MELNQHNMYGTLLEEEDVRRHLNTDCSSSDEDLTYLGVVLNCIGSICINLGTNIIKYGHIVSSTAENAPADKKGHKRTPSKLERKISAQARWEGKTYWRIGFSLFVVGNVLNFSSFSFAKQSTLAALGSVQFVTNVIFGRTVLEAVVTTRIIFGTAVIVAGNILIVLGISAGEDECAPVYTSNELFNLYGEHEYLIYIGTMSVTALAALVAYKTLKHRPFPPMNILGFCFVYSSAAVGSQSVTLFKSLSTMIRDTMSGENQLDSWFFYVVLVGAVLVAVFWVNRMNLALKKFNALFIIPVLQVNWIIQSSLGGGIYYKEFEGYSKSDIGVYVTAMVLVIFGTYLLAPVTPAPKARLRKRNKSLDGTEGDIVGLEDVGKLDDTNGVTQRKRTNSDMSSNSILSDSAGSQRPRTRSRVESGLGLSLPCYQPNTDDELVDTESWNNEDDPDRFAWKNKQRRGGDIEMGTIKEAKSDEEEDDEDEDEDEGGLKISRSGGNLRELSKVRV